MNVVPCNSLAGVWRTSHGDRCVRSAMILIGFGLLNQLILQFFLSPPRRPEKEARSLQGT